MVMVTIGKTCFLCGEVQAPASKSYTQRMVISSALSDGTSKVVNPLFSEDTEAALRAVTALGAKVEAGDEYWTITSSAQLEAPSQPIDCGESGATLRFMVPVAALAEDVSTLLFHGSIGRRPIEPLLNSLHDLGAEAFVGKHNGVDAVFVQGGGIAGGKTEIAGDVSSQFISGLMFACPLAKADTEIALTSELESADYVKMTQAVLAQHGVQVTIEEKRLLIRGNQHYKPADATVPGDFSSAAFLLAGAAVTKSKVAVGNLDYGTVQGDKAIVEILKDMGAKVTITGECVEVEGTGELLKPFDVDAKNIPDLVPVLAALACYTDGISQIIGAKRLRLKESDRLASTNSELSKMGANIAITEDGLTIRGTKLHGAAINPHKDHRIAMAAAVAALGAEGETTITYAECIRKSYPQFFHHLKQLGAEVIGGKLYR